MKVILNEEEKVSEKMLVQTWHNIKAKLEQKGILKLQGGIQVLLHDFETAVLNYGVNPKFIPEFKYNSKSKAMEALPVGWHQLVKAVTEIRLAKSKA